MNQSNQSPQQILRSGGVGILATDTLYGLVGQALNRAAVERIYRLKRRQPDKPLIILIGQMSDVTKFGVLLDQKLKQQLATYWPGATSIILDCQPDLAYLHRGTNTLAFRLPAKPSLRRLLAQTGPLVAPSANPEQQPPAQTIGQARRYFGNEVDFYRSGQTSAKPSRLIKLEGDQIITLRD